MLLHACVALAALSIHASVQDDDAPPKQGWLLAHQDADGRWDADGFARHDPPGDPSGDPGAAEFDVLATSLVLWASVGDGRSLDAGPDHREVTRGLRWLLAQQDLETGFVCEREHALDLAHHALATLVIAECQFYAPGPILRDACELAAGALLRHQRASGAFGRGDAPDDPRTTAWATLALLASADAGVELDWDALDLALGWLHARADERGMLHGAGEDGGVDEVATALTVLCSLRSDLTAEEEAQLAPIVEALLQRLVAAGGAADGETRFTVAAACYRLGGAVWREVSGHVKREVLDRQRRGGAAKGSWDAPGRAGGRVVETAWNALSLELYFRYARVIVAR
jgi:hypothetical protein